MRSMPQSKPPIAPASSNLRTIIGIVSVIAAVVLVTVWWINFSRDEGGNGRSTETSQQDDLPHVTVIKSDPRQQFCKPGEKCSTATVSFTIGQMLKGAGKRSSANMGVRFNDGVQFSLNFTSISENSQVTRIPTPIRNNPSSVAFALQGGVVGADMNGNGKSVITVWGNAFCDFRDSRFSVQSGSIFANIILHSGAAKCEDIEGSLHFLSPKDKSRLKLKIQ